MPNQREERVELSINRDQYNEISGFLGTDRSRELNNITTFRRGQRADCIRVFYRNRHHLTLFNGGALAVMLRGRNLSRSSNRGLMNYLQSYFPQLRCTAAGTTYLKIYQPMGDPFCRTIDSGGFYMNPERGISDDWEGKIGARRESGDPGEATQESGMSTRIPEVMSATELGHSFTSDFMADYQRLIPTSRHGPWGVPNPNPVPTSQQMAKDVWSDEIYPVPTEHRQGMDGDDLL